MSSHRKPSLIPLLAFNNFKLLAIENSKNKNIKQNKF